MFRPRADDDETPGVFYWIPMGFDVEDAMPLSSDEPEESGGVVQPDDVTPE